MSDIVGTKISQLPLGENLADDDLMLAVEDGTSKKVEIGYLKNRFVGDLTLADLGDDSTHRLVTDAEKTAWSGKQDALTFDNAPTSGSSNPVKSSGIYAALGTKANTSDLATVATSGSYADLSNTPTIPDELADLSDDSTHRLVTDAEKASWNGKQNALTFDDVPTDGSNNPVKSGGIYNSLASKADKIDVTEIQSDLYYTTEINHNLSNEDKTNGYIDSSNAGNIVSHVSFSTSQAIDVTDFNKTVTYANLRTVGNGYPLIACYINGTYDKSKSLVATNGDFYTGSFDIPSGVTSVRFVFYNSNTYIATAKFYQKNNNIDRLDDKIDDVADEFGTYEKTVDGSLFFDYTETSNIVIKNNGTEESRTGGKTSDYTDVSNVEYIDYEVYAITNYNAIIACYDENKVFLANKSVLSTYSGSSGIYVIFSGRFQIPSGVKYARFCWYDRSAAEESYSVTSAIPFNEDYSSLREQTIKQWEGKQWYAFGTSITDDNNHLAIDGTATGKYAKYLEQLSGLTCHNEGIAGGTIGSGGIHGGTSNILTRITSTDITDADLITIEGFVNDYAAAVSIGELGDLVNTTMYGAITLAVKYCLENSDATVCLITESTGQQYDNQGTMADYTLDKLNSLGLTQNDYNNVIRDVGKYLGVNVIDAGGESQINEFKPQYLADWIHHSELGGKQYANAIWDKLKNIHCSNFPQND